MKQEALYQELKSSGSGMTELNRESINKCAIISISLCILDMLALLITTHCCRLEEAFSDARNDQKFIRADSDRIALVLVSVVVPVTYVFRQLMVRKRRSLVGTLLSATG